MAFRVNLLGRHNTDNVLFAVSCAKKLGMSLEEISKGCLKIRPEQGSMKIVNRNPLVLDASYSANSNGVLADLDYLNTYEGKKIIVMPCLIELGSQGKEVHRRIGEKIDQVCDLAIITTKDYYNEIKSEKTIFLSDYEEILNELKKYPDSTILLEGRVPQGIKKALNL